MAPPREWRTGDKAFHRDGTSGIVAHYHYGGDDGFVDLDDGTRTASPADLRREPWPSPPVGQRWVVGEKVIHPKDGWPGTVLGVTGNNRATIRSHDGEHHVNIDGPYRKKWVAGTKTSVGAAPAPTDKPVKRIAPELLTTASILDDVRAFLTDYVVFSSLHEADAVALWILHTYIVDAFDSTPRLVIRAPQRQSGKTRLIECLKELCYCPIMTAGLSHSGMFRSIDIGPVTILLDEADTIWSGGSSDHKELQGAIDTGHRKGSVYIRCQGAELTPTPFKVFAPVAIAGIGNPPDPILDRAVIINMRRRTKSERVAPWRMAAGTRRARPIIARLAQWAVTARKEIAEPTMPPGIEDRPADVWEPLLAIAELAGDGWTKSARSACVAMAGAWAAETGDDLGLALLRDLRTVFGTDQRVPTELLLRRLVSMPESPWRNVRDDRFVQGGITDIALATMLRPYGIKPKNYRDGTKTKRGYLRAMFADAWERYLDPV